MMQEQYKMQSSTYFCVYIWEYSFITFNVEMFSDDVFLE